MDSITPTTSGIVFTLRRCYSYFRSKQVYNREAGQSGRYCLPTNGALAERLAIGSVRATTTTLEHTETRRWVIPQAS